jgi:hypothetical protein
MLPILVCLGQTFVLAGFFSWIELTWRRKLGFGLEETKNFE